MVAIEAHPLTEVFADIETGVDDYKELQRSIELIGQQQPIILYEGKVLDGMTRQMICISNKIKPVYEDYKGSDPLAYLISVNYARRHLSTSHKAIIGARLVNTQRGGKAGVSSNVQDCTLVVDRKKAAQIVNTSPRSVSKGSKVINQGVPLLQEAVMKGRMGIEEATEIASKPHEEQERILDHAIATNRPIHHILKDEAPDKGAFPCGFCNEADSTTQLKAVSLCEGCDNRPIKEYRSYKSFKGNQAEGSKNGRK